MSAAGDDSAGGAARPGRSERHFVIDMRRFEPRERLPLLEMTLPVLAPGESVELTFETHPERLEAYLDAHYADAYEWWAGGEGLDWYSLIIRAMAVRS